MGNEGRAAVVCAALLVGVLTGCSAAGSGSDAKAAVSASPTEDETARVAESGGRVGPAGSACELPVSFDVAADWKAEAVDADVAGSGGGSGKSGGSGGTGDMDDEFAREIADAFLRRGPVTAACEIDAKPAGYIGFLRVWTGEPGAGDARRVLEEFVTAEDGASEPEYRSFSTGGLDGAEVTYLVTSELLDGARKQRALAVAAPGGPVVVHLGGLDDDEHEGMLPAYELAKGTLRAT